MSVFRAIPCLVLALLVLLLAPGAAHAGSTTACSSARTLSLVRTFAAQIPELARHRQSVLDVQARSTLMSDDRGVRCAAVLDLSDGTRREATYIFETTADGPQLRIVLTDETTRL